MGDTLGLLTHGMTPVEAEFHYSRSCLLQTQLHVDKVRCRYRPGDATVATDMVLALLESVIKWGGVVDELDYVDRLVDMVEVGRVEDSPVLTGLFTHLEEFRSNPVLAAEQWLTQQDEDKVVDSLCLPPVMSLTVSQFHSLTEVSDNAVRICSATHPHTDNVSAAVCLATMISKLLQGCRTQEVLQEGKDALNRHNCTKVNSHPWVCLSHAITALGKYLEELKEGFRGGMNATVMRGSQAEEAFRGAMTATVMRGGHSTVTGCVTGSLLGLVTGFQNLPKVWVENVNAGVKKNLDKKLNNLFDLMGIP